MEYELAKELWEADYPFKRRGDATQVTCMCIDDVCDGPFGREFRLEGNLYPEPTLSELIEACGDRFSRVIQTFEPKGWEAKSTDVPQRIERKGKTPEEAVAKLWLALNKKDK